MVTLPQARPLERVVVVGTGRAAARIDVGGGWRTLGRLAACGRPEPPGGTAGPRRIGGTVGTLVR